MSGLDDKDEFLNKAEEMDRQVEAILASLPPESREQMRGALNQMAHRSDEEKAKRRLRDRLRRLTNKVLFHCSKRGCHCMAGMNDA